MESNDRITSLLERLQTTDKISRRGRQLHVWVSCCFFLSLHSPQGVVEFVDAARELFGVSVVVMHVDAASEGMPVVIVRGEVDDKDWRDLNPAVADMCKLHPQLEGLRIIRALTHLR